GLTDTVEPVQLSIRLLVPPGSRLLELPATSGFPGPLDQDLLGHRWVHEDPRMDALARVFADRAAAAARSEEEPEETFAALRELAARAAGRSDAARMPAVPHPSARRDRPPRLAEAWFC